MKVPLDNTPQIPEDPEAPGTQTTLLKLLTETQRVVCSEAGQDLVHIGF